MSSVAQHSPAGTTTNHPGARVHLRPGLVAVQRRTGDHR